jgi:tetratricopeptide (TPR) repeat protein
MRAHTLCLLLAQVFIAPIFTFAQTPTPASSAPNDPYAAESIVILHSDTLYSFAADGTGYRERTLAARIQSEAAVRSLGVVAIPYAGNSEQVQILYARVRRPDGTVVESKPDDALDMPEEVTRAAPFYSDLKQKQIPIRSLHAGDTLEWKARITRTKAEAPGNFWGQETFTEGAVVLSENIELRVPKTSYVNVWSPTAKAIESTEGDQHIYRWTSSQLKPTAGKEAEAAAEAKKKEIWTADRELDAEEGKLPAIAWTTFKSWEDVGAWYRALEADRIQPTPEIKAKAAELTTGKTTDEEKIRALYGYVATQFRYIGISFGVGRYQPHTANEILENQYGDCKDKHTLLASLLAASGIHADAVLIGAGIRFNQAVPSPSAFNHLITHLTVAGQPVWLDTTTEVAPYRMLVSVIRDKQALIVPDAAPANLGRTPAAPPFPAQITWDATGTIDKDGLSKSQIVMTLRGDDELAVRAAFHNLSPGQYTQGVQGFINGLGYAGTATNAELSRPEDTSTPFRIAFDYERDKGGDWANYRVLPQLVPVTLPRYADKDPLIRVLDLAFPRIEISHAAMKVPEGWGAEVPEAVHLKCPYVTIDITYRLEKDTVYSERRVQILEPKVPVADLKAYKKFADDAGIGEEQYITLNRHMYVGDPPSPASAPNSLEAPGKIASIGTDAAKLVLEASNAMQRGDFESAADSLDQAKEINPEQASLWGTYGLIALNSNSVLEAIDDFQKELKSHPTQHTFYPILVDTQLRLAERKQAKDTLAAWAAAAPADPAPTSRLIGMLLEEGDAKGASAAAHTAIAHLPEDPKKTASIKIGLGRAEIMSGSVATGTATVHAVLKYAEDPTDLTAGAHALADASLDLPLAESSARAALDKLTVESNTWTLDENPWLLHLRSQLIVDTWATLGWVLVREHKFDEARGYLNAAILADQNAETIAHLGDLEAAHGDKRAALNAYELALAKVPTYDGMGVRNPPGPLEKRLTTETNALIRTGTASSVGTAQDPYRRLEALRQFPVEVARAPDTHAQFRLLLKDERIVKVNEVPPQMFPDGIESISNAKLPALWPPGSHAALVRDGWLQCHAGVCNLDLKP